MNTFGANGNLGHLPRPKGVIIVVTQVQLDSSYKFNARKLLSHMKTIESLDLGIASSRVESS